MGSVLKSIFGAILLVFAAISPVQANQHCVVPQLDTPHGCVWPEQLGIRIALDQPLGGGPLLVELTQAELGAQYHGTYQFFRVANSSLIIAVQGETMIVRQMFYLAPR